ncbi:hypothetical protein A3K82_03490 [Candidatus Pacearchaeota archaeon RBG_19FT_COMBO_34_9]|nr:MAG: hypothetical protein A3K82_03490 [Candidatus Pacearchaeota archaeon RBG_19FT_COMBO_34_9]OGJ16174.1 MAG: hypothetical protein A3K74_03025 [Candidatus Pacearchaeota archaeon RBG_13_33_26]
MKAELTMGKNYWVEEYPKSKMMRGTYLGENKGIHFFIDKKPSKNPNYIIVEDHWSIFKNNTVSYTPISSSSISVIPKDKIREIEDNRIKSGLLKILNEAKQ